jgi:molecular chaperone Hsp33
MGRLLAAGLMMGINQKYDQEMITIKINSYGKVKSVLVTANNQGRIKGYIDNPSAEMPLTKAGSIDVGGILGGGSLTVIRDLHTKSPYSGSIELQNGEIGTDITWYFSQSEQTPTSVGLGVLIEPGGKIRQAGGFIVQLMPEADEEVIDILETNLHNLPNFTDLLDMGYSLEKILQKVILTNLAPKINDVLPALYFCHCSKAKFEYSLRLLEKSDLQNILEKGEDIVVKCHFCNKEYHYDKADMKRMIAECKK